MLRALTPLVAAAGASRFSKGVVATAGLRQAVSTLGAVNVAGFGISAATGSHYHIDLLGTGAFAVAALASRGSGELRQQVSAGAVTLWSVKLASFLFYRVLQTTTDARLETVLSTTSGALGFWVATFAWNLLADLPHFVAAGVAKGARPPFGRALDWAGLGVFASGFALETAADLQKTAFKQSNPGRFCDVGVWQLSQHPNYFGNLLVWVGITLLNAPTLLAPGGGGGRNWLRMAAGLLSPAFLYALFSGQATGAIGNSIELAEARYGKDPRFQRWLAETPMIIPTAASVLRFLKGGGE